MFNNNKYPKTRDFIIPMLLVFVGLLLYPSNNTPTQHQGQLSLADAKKYVRNYQSSFALPEFEEVFFSKELCERILSQPRCNGIRYYLGKKENDSTTVVVLGVDDQGKEIIDGVICTGAVVCQSVCDSTCSLAN